MPDLRPDLLDALLRVGGFVLVILLAWWLVLLVSEHVIWPWLIEPHLREWVNEAVAEALRSKR